MDKKFKNENVFETPRAVFSIRDSIIKKIGDNISSILLYGSINSSNNFCDIDILIILKKNKFEFDDLNVLKDIAQEFNNLTLDLQFMYEEEIKSPNIFSLDAHGAFFTRILKRAKVLYGENIFLNFEPNKNQLLVSLVNRIQRYLFNARQEYILGGRHSKDRNPRYHQKHVIRSMFDLLMMSQEWLEDEDVKELFTKRYPDIFNEKDWDILDSDSDNIRDYVILYEKVYNLALKEAYKKDL